jgi:metallophosphoesterase (TIGR03767 family)
VPAANADAEVLLTVAHLSDVHVCDAQSPARAEFLDRWADPDSPIGAFIEEIGTYRPQEMLTLQVAEAMVRAVNAVELGPVAGRPVDFALLTGDNIDNAQANELGWYIRLFEGGEIDPDSGDRTRYEGVADSSDTDERYWHPDSPHRDLPRSELGFPAVPGLLDAAREPFRAIGLRHPWLAVHGNHDQLLQGTVPARPPFGMGAEGSAKITGPPSGYTAEDALTLISGLARCEPAALAALTDCVSREVAPDVARRLISRDEFVRAHFTPRARPVGHGFAPDGRPYYRFDHGLVTVLVLDTVNPSGGYHGSLDREQLGWLTDELAAADRDGRYVVLASHHPLALLVNDIADAGETPRVLGDEVAALLAEHPCLVLWLNGHTHATAVTPHRGWWELTAPSLIDWPQQARIVELFRTPDGLAIAATMVDHAGDLPWDGRTGSPLALAGLSRELAANAWQTRHLLHEHPAAGRRHDRNVLLTLPDPFAAGRRSPLDLHAVGDT